MSINTKLKTGHCFKCGVVVKDTRNKKPSKPTVEPVPVEWQNYTNLDDKVVKWFKDVRGISQSTLMDLGVTSRNGWVEFNYYIGDKIVNKKSRNAKKEFRQMANAEKTFYNVNQLINSSPYGYCIIVEGEMDVLSMHECGFPNAISVPNGAGDWSVFDKYFDELEKVDEFIIAVDNDEKGKELENEIARRLGKHRCKWVEYPDGCKDANDVLVKHSPMELEKCIKNANEYPIEGVFSCSDVWDDFKSIAEHGLEKGITLNNPAFADFNELFSFQTSQLTMVTGIPSHGKTNWLEFYLMTLMLENPDIRGAWYSPENYPMHLHQSLLFEKMVGKPIKHTTPTEHEQWRKWSDEHVYLTHPESQQPTWDWVFEKMRETIARYGVKFFVIDAFNKVYLDLNGKTETQAINDLLSKLTLFKQQHDVHIFLVAHPVKMNKNPDGDFEIPTLYNINGSSHFYNQTDNGFSVYRIFPDVENNKPDMTQVHVQKVKFKHLGMIGKSDFQYNTNNGRYRKFGDQHDNDSWLGERETQSTIDPSYIQSYIEPVDPDAWLESADFTTMNTDEPF
jgi:twinkle protein